MRAGACPSSFEEVYRQYEFAPLVELAMTIAVRIKKGLADRAANPKGAGVEPSLSEILSLGDSATASDRTWAMSEFPSPSPR
jgi:hypothetical protein